MDKQYNPIEVEEKWVKIWSKRKVSNKESKESFSQVIPRQMLLAHSIWDIVSNTQLWTSILDLIICKAKTHIGKLGVIMQE